MCGRAHQPSTATVVAAFFEFDAPPTADGLPNRLERIVRDCAEITSRP